jgi:hypothetical protein
MDARSFPQGAVQGLCSAAATIFALGMTFLGYWGVSGPEPWKWNDVVVVAPLMLGFLLLIAVPLLSTSPIKNGKEDLRNARKCYFGGVTLIWVGVLMSFSNPL